MRNNNSQPSTPSGQFASRFRFPSITSPNLSPLKMLPSPFIGQNSVINHLNPSQLQNFQLEQQFGNENSQKYIQCEEIRQEQNPPLFDFEIKQQEEQSIYLDQNNILEFILKYCKRDIQKLQKARQTLQDSGPQIIKKLFDNLLGKFSKLKKTKEEMVKYCVRKSFKYITNKMRAENKEAYIQMQNSQVTALYFQKHCEGDQSISMPFQKTSQQKTMNSAFLKKIFKCRQYNFDYNQFLRKFIRYLGQFPNQLITDNYKKVKSMNQTIKKVIKNKCLKSIDQYKRLPWTRQILLRLNQFARSLVQHSAFKKQQLYQRRIVETKYSNKDYRDRKDSFDDQSFFLNQNTQLKAPVPKKNSVIILTPPLRPLTDPFPVPEEQL